MKNPLVISNIVWIVATLAALALWWQGQKENIRLKDSYIFAVAAGNLWEEEKAKRAEDQEGWSKAVELLEECVNSKGFSANKENPYALIEDFKGTRFKATNNYLTNLPADFKIIMHGTDTDGIFYVQTSVNPGTFFVSKVRSKGSIEAVVEATRAIVWSEKQWIDLEMDKFCDPTNIIDRTTRPPAPTNLRIK